MSEFKEPKILVVKDAHSTYHFKVTSKMDLHNKCIKLLKTRMDAGCYDICDYNIIVKSDAEIIDEAINKLQDGLLKSILSAKLHASEIAQKDLAKHNKWRELASVIIGMPVSEEHLDIIRQTAYQLLTDRSRYQRFNCTRRYLWRNQSCLRGN